MFVKTNEIYVNSQLVKKFTPDRYSAKDIFKSVCWITLKFSAQFLCKTDFKWTVHTLSSTCTVCTRGPSDQYHTPATSDSGLEEVLQRLASAGGSRLAKWKWLSESGSWCRLLSGEAAGGEGSAASRHRPRAQLRAEAAAAWQLQLRRQRGPDHHSVSISLANLELSLPDIFFGRRLLGYPSVAVCRRN